MTSRHTGAGEPVAGVWRGGFGCRWIVLRARGSVSWQRSLRTDAVEAMVAFRAEGGRDAMEVMFDRVAGLDVGKETLTVCVRTPGPKGRRRAETRTFKTMSESLR